MFGIPRGQNLGSLVTWYLPSTLTGDQVAWHKKANQCAHATKLCFPPKWELVTFKKILLLFLCRRQMPPTIDGQLTLEKTPSYFVTKGVPARIYNMSRDTKLLVVVRDPVTRAISDYTQTVSKRPEVDSFEHMAFLDNTTGLVDTSWGAIRIGVYAKHLERWLKYFPLSQMHFVNGELLISDPAKVMAQVQEFLGLKPVITEKHFYFNTTKGFPCLKKGEKSSNPHCLGKTKGRVHPDINPRVIQRLRDFYRPFNAKFYQMTGIDMNWPLWYRPVHWLFIFCGQDKSVTISVSTKCLPWGMSDLHLWTRSGNRKQNPELEVTITATAPAPAPGWKMQHCCCWNVLGEFCRQAWFITSQQWRHEQYMADQSPSTDVTKWCRLQYQWNLKQLMHTKL